MPLLLYAGAPLLLALVFVAYQLRMGVFGFDFRGTIWEPNRAILEGHTPYPPPVAAALEDGNPSVYPPLAFVTTIPLGWLPFTAAAVLWSSLLVVSVGLALWLAGVRDWRCYTLAATSLPVVFGATFGNLTIGLLLLTICAWRFRDSPVRSGLVVAAAVGLKLLLWPLVFWLLATRRWAAAAIAVAAGALANLAAWALIGFDGIGDYTTLLRLNSDVYATHSWSLLAGLYGLGLSLGAAQAATTGLAFVLVAVTLATARGEHGDRRAFACAAIAAVLLSPVVWPYNFILLLAPAAIAAPRLNRLWAPALVLWVVTFVSRPLAEVDRVPTDVPKTVWQSLQSPPPTAQALALAAITLGALALVLVERVARPAATVEPIGTALRVHGSAKNVVRVAR